MDKKELLEELEEGQQEIIDMLAGLPDDALLEPGVAGDWSVKDILAHLSYWEGQLVTLLFQAQRMPKPTTVHFGKEKVDELNERWRAAGKDRELEMVWQDWLGVRKQTIRRVEEFSDKDLSDPERYPWLKGVPLWQWIANDTLEHEDEHADQIREWLDRREAEKKPEE